MPDITFSPSQETVDRCCAKLGYTPTIMLPTGQNDEKGNPIKVEKPLSKEQFFHNWYAGMMDSDALIQKQAETREAAIIAIPIVTVTKQESRVPVLTQEEIDVAVQAVQAVELLTINKQI